MDSILKGNPKGNPTIVGQIQYLIINLQNGQNETMCSVGLQKSMDILYSNMYNNSKRVIIISKPRMLVAFPV